MIHGNWYDVSKLEIGKCYKVMLDMLGSPQSCEFKFRVIEYMDGGAEMDGIRVIGLDGRYRWQYSTLWNPFTDPIEISTDEFLLDSIQ